MVTFSPQQTITRLSGGNCIQELKKPKLPLPGKLPIARNVGYLNGQLVIVISDEKHVYIVQIERDQESNAVVCETNKQRLREISRTRGLEPKENQDSID